jgi:hypothetical protein
MPRPAAPDKIVSPQGEDERLKGIRSERIVGMPSLFSGSTSHWHDVWVFAQ